MDRSVSFYLISKTMAQDTIGQWAPTVEKRQVFGQVSSVTASEFFAGGQNGYKPELRITMFSYDYHGEDDLELDGKIYTVYRTYFSRTDTIELYCERRRGDYPEPEADDEDEDDGGQP